MNNQFRILIFAGGGIGDVLMTTPMFRALKKKTEGTFLCVVVVGEPQRNILKNNPYVDVVLNYGADEFKGVLGYYKFIRNLKSFSFTHCFFNYIIEKRKILLAPLIARIKYRIGFNRSSVALNKTYRFFVKSLTNQLEYRLGSKKRTRMNLDLLELIGVIYDDESYDLFIERDLNEVKKKNRVGIHPGSNKDGQIKRWNLGNFIATANKIKSELGWEIVFFIGPDEDEICEQIGDGFSIVKDRDLTGTINEIASCSYIISNDSGLAHIAAAFKIPSLVIYGPTLSNEYILPALHLSVEKKNLFCRPCFHLKTKCPYKMECLEEIKPDQVFSEFQTLIELASN